MARGEVSLLDETLLRAAASGGKEALGEWARKHKSPH